MSFEFKFKGLAEDKILEGYHCGAYHGDVEPSHILDQLQLAYAEIERLEMNYEERVSLLSKYNNLLVGLSELLEFIKDFDQSMIAGKMNVSRQTISAWVNHRTIPSLENLQTLIRVANEMGWE